MTVFAVEPCCHALARLRSISREPSNQRLFVHKAEEVQGLDHGITVSSAANASTEIDAKR